MTTRYVYLSLLLFVLISMCPSMTAAQPPVGDLLLYHDSEYPGVTAYNPATGEKLELPVTAEIDDIAISGDGRIAYVQDNDVWVLDVLNDPANPINITQTPNEQEEWLRWTPNGTLLEYQVGAADGPRILYLYDGVESRAVDLGNNLNLYWNEQGWYVASQEGSAGKQDWYVWNGQARIGLTLPTPEPVWKTFHWTPDNHLFIMYGYHEQRYGQPIGPTDIFYWDGQTVRNVAPPTQSETFMLGGWSNDGRLIVYTDNTGSFNRWYIWDGVSFTPEGIPDTSTLTAINVQGENIHEVVWMPDGRLVIVGKVDPETEMFLGHPSPCSDYCFAQLYVWDMQTLQQVTSNNSTGLLVDVQHDGSLLISKFNGLLIWSAAVFNSSLRLVFQSDSGPYAMPHRGADGSLAFCDHSNLFVWNGEEASFLSGNYSMWLMAPEWEMVCGVG